MDSITKGVTAMIILANYGFSFAETRKALCEAMPTTSGNMLIIPFAGTLRDAEAEKQGAVVSGFSEDNIYILDEHNARELMQRDYQNILATCGNTFKLLDSIRRYQLDRFIRQQVANGCSTYIGLSAGAYLACTGSIEYVKLFDDNNHISDGDFTALGLTDKYVLCHYDIRGAADKYAVRQYIGYDRELICLSGNDIITLYNSEGEVSKDE